MGGGRHQPDGDADPDPVCQAGDCYREEPGTVVPGKLPTPGGDRDVGVDGNRCHGDRPGGIPGRGVGLLPVIWRPLVGSRLPDRHHHVHHPGVGKVWLQTP